LFRNALAEENQAGAFRPPVGKLRIPDRGWAV
jgi:hypothetical protein